MNLEDSGINWDAIASRLPKVSRTTITTGELTPRNYWLIKVAARCGGDSIRGKAKALMNGSCRKWQSQWIEDIRFYAAQNGLSFEDAFIQLALGEEDEENS